MFPYSKDSGGLGAFPKMPQEQYHTQYFLGYYSPTLLFPVEGDENLILIKKRVHFISNWIVYNGPVAASFQSPNFSLIKTLYLLPVLSGHLY